MSDDLPEIGEPSGNGTMHVPDPDNIQGRIIGLGIDIVARERVARMYETHGERFLGRCFTEKEAEYCRSRRDPVPDLAVRMAAKEAAFKAIGARRGMGIGWKEFEVVLDSDFVPSLQLHTKAKARGDEIGVDSIWMSLTHEELWSAAVIIVTGK